MDKPVVHTVFCTDLERTVEDSFDIKVVSSREAISIAKDLFKTSHNYTGLVFAHVGKQGEVMV